MPRIEWPAIDANIQSVTAILGAVVALFAKALQLAGQELVPVYAVRNNVIGYWSRFQRA